MKKFEEMELDLFEDPAENEAFLEWLYLAVLAPLYFRGRAAAGCRP